MNREHAAMLGLETYTSKSNCKRGHHTPRDTATGKCLECARLLGEQLNVNTDHLKPMTWDRAQFLGLDTFTPTSKCSQGHRTARETATGECLECKKARTKAGK